MNANIFGLGTLPKNNGKKNENVPLGNLLGLNEPVKNQSANLEDLFPKPFDAAFFLDNDQGHIEKLASCGDNLTARKVPDGNMGVRLDSPYFLDTFIGGMSEKAKRAAEVFVKILLWNQNSVENLDIGSGIGPEDSKAVKEWVSRNAGKRLAVLIDYDRTLTVIEGGFLLGTSLEDMKEYLYGQIPPPHLDFRDELDDLTIEGLVEYYVGGQERMRMLQSFFDFLYENNVSIILLTNNVACPSRRGIFHEIMDVLTRNRPSTVLCGMDFGFDKKRTIQEQGSVYGKVCPILQGGKRNRKRTRRIPKKKRKTQKHK